MIKFNIKFIISLAASFALIMALAVPLPCRQILAEEESIPSRLFFRVDKSSWLDPAFFAVDLVLENNTGPVNAWQMDILYSTDSLALYQASTSPAICPFSFAPVIAPEQGLYSYICGNPDNLAATSTVLTRLIFRKLDPQAPAVLSFGGGTLVLLADGHGTALDVQTETHRIYLKK